ncbi:unnamed protein product, partial [marine sediment metagenome]
MRSGKPRKPRKYRRFAHASEGEKRDCPDCHGTGQVDHGDEYKGRCVHCDGIGKVVVVPKDSPP